MAKQYKIQVDDGKGTEQTPIRVEQGVGDKGAPVRMVAQKGARYELQQERKDGANFAPDQLRVQRKGKGLQIWFDGSKQPDVVIEGYYNDDPSIPTLMGVAENGNPYEYVPQDPDVNSMPTQLKDNDTMVAVALGGPALAGDFALAGLPLAAAAGGVSGWALAGGALLAGAAAGGGGGGGDAGGGKKVLPSGQTATLTQDAVNDTGASTTDGITKNNAPELTVQAEAGAKVVVTVAGKTYVATETSTPGLYKVKLDALPDGVYTPAIAVTNSAGTSTENGSPFTVDTSGTTNQPDAVADPNATTTLAIQSISDDTGTSTTDGVTADKELLVSGTVGAFSDTGNAQGDRLLVRFLDASNAVVYEQKVEPSNGTWAMTTPTSVLNLGSYTVKAVIVDLAGNEVTSATQSVRVVAEGVTAVSDVAAITEGVAEVSGDLVQGTGASKAGADAATHVGYADLSISQVKGAQIVVTGAHGTLTLQKNGAYKYELNNTNAEALTEGQLVRDEFTYTLSDGNGHTSEAKLTVNITGKNDVATFWYAANSKPITNLHDIVSPLNNESKKGVLTVKDPDASQNGLFNVGATPLEFNQAWQVGRFAVAKGSVEGDFDWTFNKTKSYTNADAIRHDLFTVKSIDGSASQTFDFEVTNTSAGVTKQEFHTQSTDGIKVMGQATYSDALVLRAAGFFDLTLANVSLTSVDRVDLSDTTGGAGQTVKLSLDNLMSADTVMIGSSAVHRLFVDGTNMDAVVFKHAELQATTLGNHIVDGYTLYRISDTHDLLVNTAITNVTFSNS